MKRVLTLVVLVAIASIAGIFRSHSQTEGQQLPSSKSLAGARDEIRKTVELTTGARVEVSGINGAVRVETGASQTAEVYVERTASSREALDRRKVLIDSSSTSLRIHGEKGDVSFLAHFFGSNPTEQVILKLPRDISFIAHGVNGSLRVGEVNGAVELHGINGKVEIGQAVGSAQFEGINGNIFVALKELRRDGVNINGVNGNIELRLANGLDADLETHGINGHVISDLPDVVVDKQSRGNYYARVGRGGNPIIANGINGNIRLSRTEPAASAPVSDQ